MICETNKMVDELSPEKRVQCTKRYAKWYNKNVENWGKVKDFAHNKAKMTNLNEDWRIFREARNKYTNVIKSEKRGIIKGD